MGKKEQSLELLDILRKTFPKSFFQKGKEKPLKIGVHLDVLQASKLFDSALDEKLLRHALRMYTLSYTYQVAVAAPGAVRIDLLGDVVEPVSEVHQAVANQVLKERKARAKEKGKPKKLSKKKTVNRSDEKAVAAATEKPKERVGIGINAHLPRLSLKKSKKAK